MKRKSPNRLLEPTARFTPKGVELSKLERPALLFKWAVDVLKKRGIEFGSQRYRQLLEAPCDDVVSEDIAAIAAHTYRAAAFIKSLPAQYREAAKTAATDMFQAGKRHESFDTQQKHARDVEHAAGIRRGRVRATKASAQSTRRVSDAELLKAKREGKTYDQIAEQFNISRNAVAKRVPKLLAVQPPYGR